MRDEIDAISARRVRSSRFGSLSTWYRATAHTRCAHSFALSGSEGGGPSSSNRLTTRCVRRRGAVREDVFSESISLRAYVLARCESSRCGAGGPTRAATRARRAARCRRRRTAVATARAPAPRRSRGTRDRCASAARHRLARRRRRHTRSPRPRRSERSPPPPTRKYLIPGRGATPRNGVIFFPRVRARCRVAPNIFEHLRRRGGNRKGITHLHLPLRCR